MVANQISRELFRNFWLGHNPAWFDHMETQSYPRYNISTTVFPDTIAALGKVSFNGEAV